MAAGSVESRAYQQALFCQPAAGEQLWWGEAPPSLSVHLCKHSRKREKRQALNIHHRIWQSVTKRGLHWPSLLSFKWNRMAENWQKTSDTSPDCTLQSSAFGCLLDHLSERGCASTFWHGAMRCNSNARLSLERFSLLSLFVRTTDEIAWSYSQRRTFLSQEYKRHTKDTEEFLKGDKQDNSVWWQAFMLPLIVAIWNRHQHFGRKTWSDDTSDEPVCLICIITDTPTDIHVYNNSNGEKKTYVLL